MSQPTKEQWQKYTQLVRQRRAETGLPLNGNLPAKLQKRIEYSITVKRPLKPGERFKDTQRPAKQKQKRKVYSCPLDLFLEQHHTSGR